MRKKRTHFSPAVGIGRLVPAASQDSRVVHEARRQRSVAFSQSSPASRHLHVVVVVVVVVVLKLITFSQSSPASRHLHVVVVVVVVVVVKLITFSQSSPASRQSPRRCCRCCCR